MFSRIEMPIHASLVIDYISTDFGVDISCRFF